MRHGEGRFIYTDGGHYSGDWVEGMMEGKGTLYYKEGKPAYQGDWQRDMFNGHGILYNHKQEPVR